MQHGAKLLQSTFVTHDVRQFVTTRPDGLDYEPGQGVELAIDRGDWKDQARPFTPVSPPDAPVLEFLIKEYPEQDGVTDRLHDLAPGAALRLSDAFGSLTWEGPGTFLAGGAGITPFLSIFRERAASDELGDSVLHFSNSTPRDVICERELRALFGPRVYFTCTREAGPGWEHRRIDRSYLEEHVDDVSGRFYLCGPPAFVTSVRDHLLAMGAREDGIVTEG